MRGESEDPRETRERRRWERRMYQGPRRHPCPTCGRPDALTDEQWRRGYQCDRCADRDEGTWPS
jgi:ribosomal protein L37AE/L43A